MNLIRVLTPTLFVIAVVSSVVAPAAIGDDQVIAETSSKVVKLYGAGGLQGLEAYGTGFLVSSDGHIVTSWAPLLDADPVTAVLDDGRRFSARLEGADPAIGIAVLRLEGDGLDLPHFDLTTATEPVPGDRFLAFSNMFRVAAGDEPVSVMHGTILAETPLSARRGRFDVPFDGPVYVLDAVTNNPGAAGGIIVSLDGRIVGMIGRELRGEGAEIWINYALPATAVRDRLSSLLAEGGPPADASEDRALSAAKWNPTAFGLVLVPDVAVRTPAYVTNVMPGSVAAAAGIERDDLVLFADDAPVRSIREFGEAMSRAESGDEVTLIVRRDGRLVTVVIAVP